VYKFEKLKVWQESLELIKEVYRLCDKLPKNEERNLIDQIRRATVSINLNIAEGSGSENDVEFKRYLFIAKKSLFEVIAILKVIEKLYNIKIDLVLEKIELLSKLISGLIKYLKNNNLKS
jgi:four helix bundle protein